MTLSANLILKLKAGVEKEVPGWSELNNELYDMHDDLIEFFLDIQPQPIADAPREDIISALVWCEEHGWIIAYWAERSQMWLHDVDDSQVFPTHYLPLDALPTPERNTNETKPETLRRPRSKLRPASRN